MALDACGPAREMLCPDNAFGSSDTRLRTIADRAIVAELLSKAVLRNDGSPFLPFATSISGSCGAMRDYNLPLICTREAGHDGPHAAHGVRGALRSLWV